MIGIKRCTNSAVTDFYLNIIKKALENNGKKVVDFDFKNCKKTDYIVVSTVIEFFQVYFKGYHNIIWWMQGIEPEESYMKHGSIGKKVLLEKMTYFALRHSKFIFFVSAKMREYVDDKYKISTVDYSFIMPCFNSVIDKSCFYKKNKYTNNKFCYIGSLSSWQCFEETIVYFKLIKSVIADAEFIIYTSEIEKAKEILKKYGLENVYVGCVNPEEMNSVLCDVKFGFIIRKDNPVNSVATPTKLSSYLAAGVIPIYSNCIDSFNKQLAKTKFHVEISKLESLPEEMLLLCRNTINPEEVFDDYKFIFSTYYSEDKYIEDIAEKMKKIIN
ncbi:hypothetical protein [uncultured Eubacterium sp.]|uniref:hypothetical protein n=1 Tax=uncultured Eubacterium sp. TaxID=165185 RepID=UPI0025FF7C2D|nr:hypothetical protein [uncultured Eubacterium sp.]